jgi:hypothetical protein
MVQTIVTAIPVTIKATVSFGDVNPFKLVYTNVPDTIIHTQATIIIENKYLPFTKSLILAGIE